MNAEERENERIAEEILTTPDYYLGNADKPDTFEDLQMRIVKALDAKDRLLRDEAIKVASITAQLSEARKNAEGLIMAICLLEEGNKTKLAI